MAILNLSKSPWENVGEEQLLIYWIGPKDHSGVFFFHKNLQENPNEHFGFSHEETGICTVIILSLHIILPEVE